MTQFLEKQFEIENSNASPDVDRPALLTGIVVNHTHWDREWYMPFQRYRVLLVDAVDLLLDTLGTRADYKGFMLDGQTVVAEDYLEIRPDRREQLAAFIKSGRIDLGPWYVLPDEFLPTGESLIRNLLLGRKQMRELGAPPARVGYLPDTFGHPAQLPQILAGFDLDSAVIFRGVQSDKSEFIWEAPDGTRLLTIYLPGGYYNAMEMARAPHFWLNEKMQGALEQLARFATTGAVLLMNGCDHFEPQPATQEIIDQANRLQQKVFLRQGTLEEYIDLVRGSGLPFEVKQGEWRYNRPSRITPGVLSARMYQKQANFQASVQLERGAEPLQGLAWALGGKHDTGLLGTAWRYLLQNHPHDSICGCSVDEVHRDCDTRFRWTQQIGDDLVERAGNALAKHIAGKGRQASSGPGFAVFNTLAAPRTEIIRQKLHFLETGASFRLVDHDGNTIPFQELNRKPMKIQWDPQREQFHCDARVYPAVVVSPPELGETGGRWQRWLGEEVELLFPANLPAGGYTSVRVVQDEPGTNFITPATVLKAGPNWLENEFVRVEVSPNGFFNLKDKRSGRRYGPLNVFRSEADRGDEYSFCPAVNDTPVNSLEANAKVRLVEQGPLRATLEISLVLQVPAALAKDRDRRVNETVSLPIRTRVSLGPGRRRVEVQTEVDNTAKDHRLRALFATGVHTAFADAQGQFQVMRRAVELPQEERLRVPEFDEEQEVSYHPQRAFVDVSDEKGGLALLNRGLPEYEAEPSEEGVWLGLTLLRCVGWLSREDLSTRYKHAGPALETPEAQCPGVHTFEYAVVPHEGDWLSGGVAQEAEGYITPVWSAPLSPDFSQNKTFTPEYGFYRLGPAELLFSACKRSEDGNSLLIRAYNSAPYPVDALFELGLEGAVRLANLAERAISEPLTWEPSVSGKKFYHFPVGPHQIFTLSVSIGSEK